MYRKIQIFVLQSHLPQNINTFWLAIYYTYTHTLSLSLSVTGGKAPNESFPCYKSPVRENVAFVIPIQRFVRAKPVASTNIFQPTRIFVRRCVFFPFFLRSKRKREREKIYIYILATKCTGEKVRLFLMRARVGLVTRTRDVPDGIGECNGATSARRRWRSAGSGTRSRAGQIRLGLFVMLHLCSANGVAF